MDISFDPAKNARNIELRGISFECAVDFDWSLALVFEDWRRDYGELRYRALGLIAGRLHMLVFTRREDRIHVISLRKANIKRDTALCLESPERERQERILTIRFGPKQISDGRGRRVKCCRRSSERQ